MPQGRSEEGLLLPDPSSAFPPDCEPPLKKEASLPEGPVLEALLCAETGDKKPELKEEELILDCPVREGEGRGPPPQALRMREESGRSLYCPLPPSFLV